ncbi:MAG: hypothetical protein R3F65_06050 [bacterium]
MCAGGVRVCGADGAGVVCNAAPAAPGVEACNGADDDCDGTADEGVRWVGDAVFGGGGAVRAAGDPVCGEAGAVVCNAVEGVARAEV